MSEESAEMEMLKLRAEELQINVDGRWSEVRLREEIDKKLGIEKRSVRDTLIRQVVALGLAEDAVQDDWDEKQLQAMFGRMQKMHRNQAKKLSNKRLKLQHGEDFDKTATVRVLKNGDGKISTGIYVAGIGNICHDRGDTIENMALYTAKELEERGFVEIQEMGAA